MIETFADLARAAPNGASRTELPVVCVQGLGFVGSAMAAAVADARDARRPCFRVFGAIEVRDERQWAVWPRLARLEIELLVQQLVPGPETAVESYHAYVDADGVIAGEFIGRKIRIDPPRFGYSTAVEVIELPYVAELGGDVLRRLALTGVAKADFKRDERGQLHLLEIHPRFTLWHHPAALGGVNIPALVHADLAGRPRPHGRRATRTIAWCKPFERPASRPRGRDLPVPMAALGDAMPRALRPVVGGPNALHPRRAVAGVLAASARASAQRTSVIRFGSTRGRHVFLGVRHRRCAAPPFVLTGRRRGHLCCLSR